MLPSSTSAGAAHWATILLGIVWLSLGLAKAFAPSGLIAFLETSTGSGAAGAVLAWCVVAFECVLGASLVSSLVRPSYAPRVVAMVYAVGIVVLLLVGGKPIRNCGCLGYVDSHGYGRRMTIAGCILVLGAVSLRAHASAARAEGG